MQAIPSTPLKARLRISVVALLVDGDDVLLIHQATPPEPDCWDLPGGGLEPHESLLDGLRREVREETGLTQFTITQLLTVVENFFPEGDDGLLHTINLVYQCSVPSRTEALVSQDPEIGPKGIRWMPIQALQRHECSTRCWQALGAAALRV